MSKVLTNKQRMFVQEYLCDLNATQAAIRAGYSEKTAGAVGAENLTKPEIATAIQEAMDKRSKRTDLTADMVLTELKSMGFSNIQDAFDEQGRLLPVWMMDRRVAASISSIKVSSKTVYGTDPIEIEHVTEMKFWDKPKSLEMIGRHLKMWNDVGSKENPLTFDQLTDEQLDARIAALVGQ